MDPVSNGEWSASEIQIMKSLITMRNTNSNCANNMNKRHDDILNELQEMFPLKEKKQVTSIYVHLMVEMMHTMQSNNQHATSTLMDENFRMPLEDPAMGNMEVLRGYLMEGIESMRKVEEAPQRQSTPHKERQHNKRFWTIEEHRQFIHGMHAYGRGNWKNISKHFVPNKTPIQICSHAQKYFRRIENPTKKKRYSINDASLYDTEPWAQNNPSSCEVLGNTRGSYNPNQFGSSGQFTAMNNMSNVRSSLVHGIGQVSSSSQTATLASGQQQQMGASSSFGAPMMEGAGRHIASTNGQQGEEWIMNMLMN